METNNHFIQSSNFNNPNNLTRIIGDVHGKFPMYFNLLKSAYDKGINKSIQLGDMGLGFGPKNTSFSVDNRMTNLFGDLSIINGYQEDFEINNQQFIRGNHDDVKECQLSKRYIPDASFDVVSYPNNKIMYLGGGLSIDRFDRKLNSTYWNDEELSFGQLQEAINVYNIIKPDIMFTHDCPELIAQLFMMPTNTYKIIDPSRTRLALQTMLEAHMPKLWVFGHWHVRVDRVFNMNYEHIDPYTGGYKTKSYSINPNQTMSDPNGTRFVCIEELGYIDLDLNSKEFVYGYERN